MGGENNHLLQCESEPEVFNDNLHGVHSEPCYKKQVKQDYFHFYYYLRKSCLMLFHTNKLTFHERIDTRTSFT